MYMELQKKVIDETKLRNVNIFLFKKKAIIISLKFQNQKLEAEVDSQINMRNELESAIKILDKNLSDKLEFITQLRNQLDQVKQINLELMEKFQVI